MLGIVKWLFIIIASILTLILFIILLVLFTSIRFEGYARYNTDGDKKTAVKFKVGFVLNIFRISFEIRDGNSEFWAALLWKRLSRKKNADEPEEIKSDETESQNSKDDEKRNDETEEVREEVREEVGEEVGEEVREEAGEEAREETEDAKEKKTEKKKPTFNFSEKWKRLRELRDKARGVVDHPDRDMILKYTLRLVIEEIKAFKFKVFKLGGIVGFDDPSITGYLFAVVGIIRAATALDIALDGYFEGKKLELSGDMRGKTSFWALLFPLIKWAFKEPIWKLIKPIIFKNKRKEGKA